MLVTLTPSINFSNILRAAFAPFDKELQTQTSKTEKL